MAKVIIRIPEQEIEIDETWVHTGVEIDNLDTAVMGTVYKEDVLSLIKCEVLKKVFSRQEIIDNVIYQFEILEKSKGSALVKGLIIAYTENFCLNLGIDFSKEIEPFLK